MNSPTNQSAEASAHTTEHADEDTNHKFEEGGILRLRKHVTSACFPCKNGKVKCDGQQPCVRCYSKNVVCTYRSDEDGRSRIPMKRRIETLEYENTVLQQLIHQIRGADDIQVRQIASLIRSNASLEEVNHTIQRLKQSARSNRRSVDPMINDMSLTTARALSLYTIHGVDVKSSTMPLSFSPERINRVLSVHRLVDEPLYQISAVPWTTVTKDNDLVSHLISLWATWYHLLPDGVVLEPFLRSMRAARLDSLLCSPFLVNCVLAAGCLFSDYDEAKTVRGKPADLMESFVKEALWHLGQDHSAPTITNVQGLGILYVLISQLNQDRDGYLYAVQAATMVDELLRARERILATAKTPAENKELAFILDTACWGTYSMTTASMSAWMRPQLIPPPQKVLIRAAQVNATFHATRWSPYPRNEASQEIHLDDSLFYHYKLAVLTAELTHIIYRDLDLEEPLARLERLHDLYVRLIFWRERLPRYMKQETPECLSAIMLLIWYHGIVLTLLKAKAESYTQARAHSKASDDDEEYDSDYEGVGGESIRRAKSEASEWYAPSREAENENSLVQQALRMAELLSSTRDTSGYSRLHCFMCQPVFRALYVLMERNNDHQYDAELTELLTAMRAMSRRFPFTFTLLRMTQLDMRLRNFQLPASAEKLFDEYDELENAAWHGSETSNSAYPSPQISVGPYTDERHVLRGDVNPTNMMEFLKVFDAMRIK